MTVEPGMTMGSAEVRWSREAFAAELTEILDWWLKHTIDEAQGGFIGRMDARAKVYPKADKGVILNARLLWTFSAAALDCDSLKYRQAAHRAFEYLNDHFLDRTDGGYYWMVDYQGQPIDLKKQIYAQAFTIYALGAYYEFTAEQAAADLAIELIWLVEKYSLDDQNGGYRNVFEKGWDQAEDMRLSTKDADEAKIMNTHLHVLEAYANFYRVRPFPVLRKALLNLLQLFEKYFCRPNGSLQIYFDDNWNPVGENVSFGHDIEASWLLYEAALTLGDEPLIAKWTDICLRLARNVLEHGIDTDGAILYEADAAGNIIDYDKHWWPQVEAVVGFWNAYELTGDATFQRAAYGAWNFASSRLKDKQNGEWHWRTNRKGRPIYSENKVGPWKAPYHNGRMCLEMMKRLSDHKMN